MMPWRIHFARPITLLFAASVAAASAALGGPVAEDPGYGPLKWGMSEAQLQQFFPSASLVDQGSPGDPPPPFTLNKYGLERQRLGKLRDCTVELHFFNKVFYQFTATCPGSKKAIESYLQDRYGSPSLSNPPVKEWTMTRTHVGYTAASGVFLVDEVQTSKQVGMALLGYALRGGGARPAATPQGPGAAPRDGARPDGE